MANIYIDCIGDSLTASIVSPAYPQILRKKIKEEKQLDIEVRNRGKYGFTVADYAKFQMKPVSKKLMTTRQPDYILILLGTNDTRSSVNTAIEKLHEDYLNLIDSFTETTPKSKLIFGLLPPYYGPVKIKWEGELHLFNGSNKISNQINPLINDIASRNNYPVVDCYTPMKSAGPSIYLDGIHPNREGNQILAESWFQKLIELF